MARVRKVQQDNGQAGMLKALKDYWFIIVFVCVTVATWTRMETRVNAMEPIQKQVQELNTSVTELRHSIEIEKIKQSAANESIVGKLDSIVENQKDLKERLRDKEEANEGQK